MKKKNLFILRSPLQIINAIEAINHFKLENNILVIIYNLLDTNTKQIKKLINSYKWENIIELEDTNKSKLFRYVSLIKRLQEYSYDYLFIGNYGTIQKIILPNLNKKKVFYLDDGTETISTYNKYIKPNKLNKYNLRELRFLLFGLKIKVRDRIHLFTYFELKPLFKDQIIKNNLSFFKEKYLLNSIEKKSIYFIGQPLDSVNVLSIENYINVIVAISKTLKKQIIYIPHRSESNDMQNAILKIDHNLLKIENPNMPIELFFLERNIYPHTIISFFSTALTTISMLYKDTSIRIVEIPYDKIENKNYYNNFLKNYYNGVDKNTIITFKSLSI